MKKNHRYTTTKLEKDLLHANSITSDAIECLNDIDNKNIWYCLMIAIIDKEKGTTDLYVGGDNIELREVIKIHTKSVKKFIFGADDCSMESHSND